MPPSYPVPTQMVQQLWEGFTIWIMRSYPLRDYPLNIRPGMIFATAGWVILLGILGMAPLPELPVNDKALHFFGLGFATFLIYFVIDVPDGQARRVWYLRRAPLLFTLVTSFFIGGIISEFVQSSLPWKTFQFGDIVANLLGSTLFLYLAHLAHTRLRKRQELSTLYQPLSAQSSSTYRDAQGRQHAFSATAQEYDEPSNGHGSGAIDAENRESGRGREGSGVWDDESDLGRGSDDTARGGNSGSGGYGGVSVPVFSIEDDDNDDVKYPKGDQSV
ncbi:hypothetical protein IAR55_004325 [Kwoniella newhampshirensis]|uniref:VanZ-like domain-containing protein n=1 Tax=Kwoniella newhampshirensis TaxID=1651941 RepID=A0AAW0YXL5_9TREE